MALSDIAATSEARRPRPVRRNFGNLGLFLVNQALTHIGTWLQFVALGWLVSELTRSAAGLGWVTAAVFGPLLVLGLWTGALADRLDKHRLLVVSHFLIAVQATTLGVVVLGGGGTLPVLYGLTVVFGLIHAAETPARRAFVAELVDENRVQRAVGLIGAINPVGRVVGPIGAGALIATVGIGWCFVATGAAYLIAMTALLAVRREALRAAEAVREPGAVRAGLRYAWKVPELRIALVMTGILATFGFNHQVLIPALADQAFEGDIGAHTLLYSVIGVGSVLGALAVVRLHRIDLRILAGAAVAFALANGLLATAPNVALAAVAAVLTGAAAALFVTASTALLQRHCAPAMRGRVMALAAMVLVGGLPIGGPVLAMIVDAAGPRAGVMVGSVAALLAGAAALGHRPARARVPALPATGIPAVCA